jgi:hypothetical protein
MYNKGSLSIFGVLERAYTRVITNIDAEMKRGNLFRRTRYLISSSFLSRPTTPTFQLSLNFLQGRHLAKFAPPSIPDSLKIPGVGWIKFQFSSLSSLQTASGKLRFPHTPSLLTTSNMSI